MLEVSPYKLRLPQVLELILDAIVATAEQLASVLDAHHLVQIRRRSSRSGWITLPLEGIPAKYGGVVQEKAPMRLNPAMVSTSDGSTECISLDSQPPASHVQSRRQQTLKVTLKRFDDVNGWTSQFDANASCGTFEEERKTSVGRMPTRRPRI